MTPSSAFAGQCAERSVGGGKISVGGVTDIRRACFGVRQFAFCHFNRSQLNPKPLNP